ncbi:AMSH-like ubiquitin thioesterase 2 isoform X1 [Tanacetum coccineum]
MVPSKFYISTLHLCHALVRGNKQSHYFTKVELFQSTQLLDGFLDLAKDNTSKDLETCGVLGAFLKEGTYYVTTLIIPKQDSTSNSCQAVNEEEIFAIQNEGSLFPVGWIHTHPSQSCFMSSVDLHTQYSYQVMVPEAVAIVMAPTDTSKYASFVLLLSASITQ